jgi:predicted transcriptional regulator
MKISKMQELLDAKVLCCEENLGKHVYSAFGCDLMSDVLAYVTDQSVLLTGLVNPQVIRTAMMLDMVCIIFVRSKVPSDEMIQLAKENGIVMMSTEKTLYNTCGLLYANGLVGIKEVAK